MKLRSMLALLTLAAAVSCEKEAPTPNIAVQTLPATVVYDDQSKTAQVTFTGEIAGDSWEIYERGFIWSKEDPFDTKKEVVEYESEAFATTLTKLESDKTYYVKAYARTHNGDFYGEYLSFLASTKLTLEDRTDPVGDVLATQIDARGRVLSNGGSLVSACGAYVGPQSDPRQMKFDGAGPDAQGDFTVTITGLTHSTQYMVTLFAVNSQGEVTTDGELYTTPVVTIPVAELDATEPFPDVKPQKLTVKAKLTDRGNDPGTRYGIRYGTSAATLGAPVFATAIDAQGVYSIEVTGLQMTTTYYFAAYAENLAGDYTSTPQTVTTLTEGPPTVATLALVQNVDYLDNAITLKGKMTDDGGRTLVDYGFYLGTSEGSMTRLTATGIDVEGNFTLTVTADANGILPLTKYYYRAFAKNIEESMNTDTKNVVTGIADTDTYVRNATMDFTTTRLVYWTLDPITATVGGQSVQLIFLDRNLGATKTVDEVTDKELDYRVIGNFYRWGSVVQVSAEMANLCIANRAVSTTIPSVGGVKFNGYGAVSYASNNDETSWKAMWSAEPPRAANPCPAGFHIPSREEYMATFLATGATTAAQVCALFKLCSVSGDFNGDGKYEAGIFGSKQCLLYTDTGLPDVPANPVAARILTTNPASTGNDARSARLRSLPVRCVKDY